MDRCVKGHAALNEEFKFKDDDALQAAIHAQTTDKIILFDTSGKFFNLNASEIPSGRGFGQPLRLMVDLGISDNICEMFVFDPKAQYLIASNAGKGFLVDENHILAQTRNGRKIMNLAEGEAAVFCRRISGDMVAIIGDNRKLLVFKLEEIPTMARGRGVTLQKYKDGGRSGCPEIQRRRRLCLYPCRRNQNRDRFAGVARTSRAGRQAGSFWFSQKQQVFEGLRKMAEILFEFVRNGNIVKVTAIEPETRIEAAVVVPAGLSEDDMKLQAMKRLNYCFEKALAEE